jgi:hypothetical protein
MSEALAEVCPSMRIHCESDGPRENVAVIDSAVMSHYSKKAKSKRGKAGSLLINRIVQRNGKFEVEFDRAA